MENSQLNWYKDWGQVGFIHKFCVSRRYAGLGISYEFIQWAIEEVRKRNRNFLRLDCAADRPKLCNLYEKHGFIRVDRKLLNGFDVAFYEIKVTS